MIKCITKNLVAKYFFDFLKIFLGCEKKCKSRLFSFQMLAGIGLQLV